MLVVGIYGHPLKPAVSVSDDAADERRQKGYT
jgi:hypothetical protein